MMIAFVLQRYLEQLPEQIELLRTHAESLLDADDRVRFLDDLASYENRMRSGLQMLLHVDDETMNTMQIIREPSPRFLLDNAVRYLEALRGVRAKNGLVVSEEESHAMEECLRSIPLIHATRFPENLREHGIHPASDLWMTSRKSSANAMDIALGLDEFVFCTHGFHLSNFADSFVTVSPELTDSSSSLCSAVDIFKLVLMRTGKMIPCSIETEEWLPVLPVYSRQLFRGDDFWRLKAEYVLTYFSSLDDYHSFAASQFYANAAERMPDGELPFLGEVKLRGVVRVSNAS